MKAKMEASEDLGVRAEMEATRLTTLQLTIQ